MRKPGTRASSKIRNTELPDNPDKKNQLPLIEEEGEVTQPANTDLPNTSAPPDPVIPTRTMSTYKAIYVPSNVIQPSDITNPVPETMNKVDVKVVEFKISHSGFAPKVSL